MSSGTRYRRRHQREVRARYAGREKAYRSMKVGRSGSHTTNVDEKLKPEEQKLLPSSRDVQKWVEAFLTPMIRRPQRRSG